MLKKQLSSSRRVVGSYARSVVGNETADAFVPLGLSPSKPPLDLDRLSRRSDLTEHALDRLDLTGNMVPSLDWFLYAFVRKEAVITSQIEGTQATLVDLFAFDAGDQAEPNAEVREVCNYLDALDYTREQLGKARGLPLSMRLLNEAHRRQVVFKCHLTLCVFVKINSQGRV